MMMMNGGTRNLFLHCISSHPPAHLVAHQHHIHRYITSNSRKAGTTTISHSNPSSSSSSRVTCNAVSGSRTILQIRCIHTYIVPPCASRTFFLSAIEIYVPWHGEAGMRFCFVLFTGFLLFPTDGVYREEHSCLHRWSQLYLITSCSTVPLSLYVCT